LFIEKGVDAALVCVFLLRGVDVSANDWGSLVSMTLTVPLHSANLLRVVERFQRSARALIEICQLRCAPFVNPFTPTPPHFSLNRTK
jgi:hypothetical protein